MRNRVGTFWRCQRCEKLRSLDEEPTQITIDIASEATGWYPMTYRVCRSCVREMSDEAADRSGLHGASPWMRSVMRAESPR